MDTAEAIKDELLIINIEARNLIDRINHGNIEDIKETIEDLNNAITGYQEVLEDFETDLNNLGQRQRLINCVGKTRPSETLTGLTTQRQCYLMSRSY